MDFNFLISIKVFSKPTKEKIQNTLSNKRSVFTYIDFVHFSSSQQTKLLKDERHKNTLLFNNYQNDI